MALRKTPAKQYPKPNGFIAGALEHISAFAPRLRVNAIDIGAADRVAALPSRFRRHINLIAFEPNADARTAPDPSYANETWSSFAISDQDGDEDFYIARKAQLSSLRQPNAALVAAFPDAERFDVLGQRKCQVRTLDAALAELGVVRPDFIKIDAQGSTAEVLNGGRKALSSALGLMVEVECLPLYQGQTLAWEVLGALYDAGFNVFELRPVHWLRKPERDPQQRFGQLVFLNALAFRRAEWFSGRSRADVLRYAFVLFAYGFADVALGTLDAWARDRADGPAVELARRIRQTLSFETCWFAHGTIPGWDPL